MVNKVIMTSGEKAVEGELIFLFLSPRDRNENMHLVLGISR